MSRTRRIAVTIFCILGIIVVVIASGLFGKTYHDGLFAGAWMGFFITMEAAAWML